jgi:MYXO-CTERM domain-containing protein
MRFLRPVWLILVLGLVLGPSGPAGAASIAPPGNSAVDQYFESVPAAGGNQPPAAGATVTPRHVGGLSPGTRHVLAASGPDGAAAAALASSGAPAASASGSGGAGGSASGSSGQTPGVVATPPAIAQLPRTTTAGGGSGISPVLPIVLGAVALAALAVALVRRRRRSPPPPPA